MSLRYITQYILLFRPGPGKYSPGDIDPSLCTHIIYAFAVLDATRLVIKPHDTWTDIDNSKYFYFLFIQVGMYIFLYIKISIFVVYRIL